jgi:hypothetical protein
MTDRRAHINRLRRTLVAGIAIGALALTVVGRTPLPIADLGSGTPVVWAQTEGAVANAPATVTPSQTEGPYYKAGSPERTSLLEPGMAGTPLTITGYVLTSDGRPVTGAWLDFWQADASGQYDNRGYTLRGHQYTDADGRFVLETIVPGEYPGRTEHIHVKVQAPNGKVLTTQLYFPGVARNATDGIFNPALLLPIEDTADGKTATFTFVVPTA